MPEQIFAIFAFGFVMTCVVGLGIVRARDIAARQRRAQEAAAEAWARQTGEKRLVA